MDMLNNILYHARARTAKITFIRGGVDRILESVPNIGAVVQKIERFTQNLVRGRKVQDSLVYGIYGLTCEYPITRYPIDTTPLDLDTLSA